MPWLPVIIAIIVVVGAIMVYGYAIDRRRTPEQREADAERARFALFGEWYADRRSMEKFLAKVPEERARGYRRRFTYYAGLRQDGIDDAYAFVASAAPLVEPEALDPK